MLQAAYTQYSDPSVPPQAIPHNIPQTPWSQLYRSAPGAQIPSTMLPQLSGPSPIQFQGALGQPTRGGVTLVGLGQEPAIGPKTLLLLNAVIAAGVGVALAYTMQSDRPALWTAALFGSVSVASGALWMSAK
ncbi:hypothetical protein LCGC14_0522850 [marine sediment metagenome]|uniref:Uncharacterized protein n=1 Tax=marine sediment metagenome TaxID=412755 RepID=A0A0F9V678_9ZZZZ